ncbi:MAG: hypothetical protein ACI9GK_002740 [Devosia sp.]|jgi:hypothetical protein
MTGMGLVAVEVRRSLKWQLSLVCAPKAIGQYSSPLETPTFAKQTGSFSIADCVKAGRPTMLLLADHRRF